MAKVTLALDELTCPSCLTKIKQAVSSTPGVTNVKVLFNAGKVKAEFDPEVVQAEKIAAVVTDLGYEVKSNKTTV
ncbi:heavy-metal-associated domain-containing protein [Lactobacillus sp. CC-MHH1034]|uniref:heavy-metal-associated domain-containing protein n=1 Tax=Agrilactobacillus fermenti TaxID=2586909 RepID=UPI001E4BC6A6|nr:heavy-metal-associated domain-containing protein [Agrilactobacillus fermenti]MCD2257021.1 heavy-metal-associated domain-containing protein [Agrilactobacillus fermenti]